MIGGVAYDHRVTVWGSQDVRGATFGDVEREWSRVPGMSDVRMKITPTRETRSDEGPGERVVGEYEAFAASRANIVEGDVLEVLEGPEASRNPDRVRKLRVDAAYPNGMHQTELVLTHWDGALS